MCRACRRAGTDDAGAKQRRRRRAAGPALVRRRERPVRAALVESGLVFTSSIGTPTEPRNLNRHFVGLLDKAGLRRIRFHDLRHSCATLLYEQGVDINKIQDILGHSSPTITKLIYVEVTREGQRDTANKLGYLFDA
jgi:integrase